MTILDQIIATKKAEVAAAKKIRPLDELKDTSIFFRKCLSLKAAVENGSGIIAEFKRRSPSKGTINAQKKPLQVVPQYEKHGASGISILTDSQYFGGSLADLTAVRQSVNIPILRKDFMVDAYQFYEAKAAGADVVLLIAANLSPQQVQEFTSLSHELGLEVLLEIHTETELLHIDKNIDMVGINNRNLKDFKVDLQHAVQLKNFLPQEMLSVAESGIYSVGDFKFLKEKGFDAFLMGEYFMKNQEPGEAFEAFMKSAGF